jgi:hypothetical protein
LKIEILTIYFSIDCQLGSHRVMVLVPWLEDLGVSAHKGREERGVHIIIERSVRLAVFVYYQEDLGVSARKGREERGVHIVVERSVRLAVALVTPKSSKWTSI